MGTLLFLADDHQSAAVNTTLFECLKNGSHTRGHEALLLSTTFPPTNSDGPLASSARSARHVLAAAFAKGLEPLEAGARIIMLSEPSFWFNMSIRQKAMINDIYSGWLPARGDSETCGCYALVLCTDDSDSALFKDGVAAFEELCDTENAITGGILVVNPIVEP